ncbi:uncharacterized protein LOC134460561 [Engraulis encrasicolus]|uniref:uncharacterized protein LOC134460561 n=1 Tax=Engraulis encrasicolus TaxID=184585 RepID=UPI002FD57468
MGGLKYSSDQLQHLSSFKVPISASVHELCRDAGIVKRKRYLHRGRRRSQRLSDDEIINCLSSTAKSLSVRAGPEASQSNCESSSWRDDEIRSPDPVTGALWSTTVAEVCLERSHLSDAFSPPASGLANTDYPFVSSWTAPADHHGRNSETVSAPSVGLSSSAPAGQQLGGNDAETVSPTSIVTSATAPVGRCLLSRGAFHPSLPVQHLDGGGADVPAHMTISSLTAQSRSTGAFHSDPLAITDSRVISKLNLELRHHHPGIGNHRTKCNNRVSLNIETVCDLATKARPTTCLLDPMPSSLVKACLPVLSPLLTNIINTSLLTGIVPNSLKIAAITPVLKKTGAAADDFKNYRPISNLPFISKLLERTVALQLQEHMTSFSLWEELQSGFRAKHSTETALVKVVNDLLLAADSGHFSILLLLDLTAAFDTVCHNVLLTRLETLLGITGTALSWFRSYLTGREQFVSIGDFRSPNSVLTHGVPQGSVLGPLLFIIYILPLGNILRKHGLNFHCYADDTQIYIHTKPSHPLPLANLTTCLNEISNWMTQNFLKLNQNKTEAIIIATPSLLKKINLSQFSIPDYFTSTSSEVRNLGVIIDSSLSFESHIKHLTKTAFFHLKTISRLRPSLTPTSAETLIHAFVTSRLDYCNALLTGLPTKLINRLQYIQNSAARLLTHTRPWHHITPILYQLHWLPIHSRIHFKILLLVYKAQHNLAPSYITSLLTPYNPTRTLRSTDSLLLTVPSTHLRTMGDRAFSVVGPKLWNSLPLSLRQCSTLSTFKSKLKTHLFISAFPLQ